jgi:dTDP-glucose 4,6-dehydratase
MASISEGKKTMKRVVYITGCLGFMGIHVTRACLAAGFKVLGVDKKTYASNDWALVEFLQNENFRWLHQDINDIDRLVDCDYIINMAAETHVDNSIMSSGVFLHSNINGVYRLLELIRQIPRYKQPILLHFSTDEVYGDIASGSHRETDLLCPSNPYSASKAAGDMLITAWARTYDMKYVIVRPTNNYGIGQYVEKLIPKSIKYLGLGRLIDLHDRGEPRRTWLHASDTARAVLTIIKSEAVNEIYNISGNVEMANHEVIKKILHLYFGENKDDCWLDYIIDSQRQGQDIRYSINDSKLRTLGWKAEADFDQELALIVEHYKTHFIW